MLPPTGVHWCYRWRLHWPMMPLWPEAKTSSAAKGVLATVGDVQEAVLVLVIFVHVRHKSSCTCLLTSEVFG